MPVERYAPRDLAACAAEHTPRQREDAAATLSPSRLTPGRLAELRNHRGFAAVWNGDQDFASLSERDLALAKEALRAGASREEAAGAIATKRPDGKAQRRDYLSRTVANAVSALPDDGPRTERAHSGRRVDLVLASQVEPEAVEWLWDGRLPLRAVSLLVGPPGVGRAHCRPSSLLS